MESATAVFKELGLSQEGAQKLVDIQIAQMKAFSEASANAYVEMRNGWRKDVIASDLGNGTDDLKPEVKATISRAIDSLPTTEATAFRKVLAETGAGDNPAFIRAFHNMAKRMTEGRQTTPGGPSRVGQPGAQPQSIASAMYPNNPTTSVG